MHKIARSLGGSHIDVVVTPTLDPLHLLHFLRKLHLEGLLQAGVQKKGHNMFLEVTEYITISYVLYLSSLNVDDFK